MSSPKKRGEGTSCHHCKKRIRPNEMLKCTRGEIVPTNSRKRKRPCVKKYCFHCIKTFYSTQYLDDNSSGAFICPACRDECRCAACRRRVMKAKLKTDGSLLENEADGEANSILESQTPDATNIEEGQVNGLLEILDSRPDVQDIIRRGMAMDFADDNAKILYVGHLIDQALTRPDVLALYYASSHGRANNCRIKTESNNNNNTNNNNGSDTNGNNKNKNNNNTHNNGHKHKHKHRKKRDRTSVQNNSNHNNSNQNNYNNNGSSSHSNHSLSPNGRRSKHKSKHNNDNNNNHHRNTNTNKVRDVVKQEPHIHDDSGINGNNGIHGMNNNLNLNIIHSHLNPIPIPNIHTNNNNNNINHHSKTQILAGIAPQPATMSLGSMDFSSFPPPTNMNPMVMNHHNIMNHIGNNNIINHNNNRNHHQIGMNGLNGDNIHMNPIHNIIGIPGPLPTLQADDSDTINDSIGQQSTTDNDTLDQNSTNHMFIDNMNVTPSAGGPPLSAMSL